MPMSMPASDAVLRYEVEDALAGIPIVAIPSMITAAISSFDAEASSIEFPPAICGIISSFCDNIGHTSCTSWKQFCPSQCLNPIVPKRWKSQEECCPCVTYDNCVAIFTEDGPPLGVAVDPCQAGMSCFKTAMEYPTNVGCYTELNFPSKDAVGMNGLPPVLENHWFSDISACRYNNAPLNGEPNFVIDAANGDKTFTEACGCQFWDSCDKACGIMAPETRRTLNIVDESRPHHRRVVENEDGVSINVESDHDERLDWLKLHVADMQQRVVSGKATRSWDPLFKTYFENVGDINLDCSASDESVRCNSNGNSQCALDLIQAITSYHSEIAASIKENGTHQILEVHDVPDSCK